MTPEVIFRARVVDVMLGGKGTSGRIASSVTNVLPTSLLDLLTYFVFG